MLTKTLLTGLVALVTITNAAFTPSISPTTKCTTIGTGHRKTRSYTRTSSCVNTLPRTRTSTTTTTTQPVSTSTVVVTDTSTADTSTSTATETSTETDTISVTSTETVTSTASTTTTTTITQQYPMTTTATKRDLEQIEERAAATPTTTRSPPPPGVVCVVTRCHRTRSTTTVTSTSVLPQSTTVSTSTQTTVVTPNADTTVTVTDTTTSTSSFTDTTTATTTSTSTQTVTYTATPTFYIMSSENPNIPDGTNLTNVPDRTQGEGQATFAGAGTLFSLNPANGMLYDTNTGQIANANSGSNSVLYFDTEALILDGNYPVCDCAIDSSYDLSCTCGGNSIFQTAGQLLFLASSSGQTGLSNEQPVVDIVAEN